MDRIGIIFDMDGVLLDTEQMFLDAVNRVSEEYGLGDLEGVARACIGTTDQETQRIMMEMLGPGFPFEKYRGEASRVFHEMAEKGIPLKKGARETLTALKEKGYPLALASSTRTETVKEELQSVGLLSCFDEVVGGDMAQRSKPAPDIFLLAAEKMGIPPADCFVIEDSPNGIRAAAAAGMHPLMVPDLVQPDGEIRGLTEGVYPDLLAMLRKWI